MLLNYIKSRETDSISARILGGTKVAGNGEYPWQCLLITSDGSYCGCVVVDSKMILTAAHCVVTASEAYVQSVCPFLHYLVFYSKLKRAHGLWLASSPPYRYITT